MLRGQRALVTGATSGIGAEIARALAAAGAKVVGSYVRSAEQAERVVKEIKAEGGEAMAVAADVSEQREVKAMFERMFEAYGSIDVLVNSTAIHKNARLIDTALADLLGEVAGVDTVRHWPMPGTGVRCLAWPQRPNRAGRT